MNKKRLLLVILIPVSLILIIGSGYLIYIKYSNNLSSKTSNIDSTNRTTNKAIYLAQRVLLNPSIDEINQISNMSNYKDVVTSLFTNASDSENQKFQAGVLNFRSTQQNKYKNQSDFESALYAYKLIHDPNKAKQNLYHLWENIFSVDAPDKAKFITSDDGITLSNLIYDNTYGNYIDLVEKVRTNYAMTSYLDLIYSPKNNPNENFSRELLQLFLMGQYSPTDTTNTTENYSDSDVNALAYILTGYKQTGMDHIVAFNQNYHYTGTKLFLGEQYNDPTNVVKYIVQKKRIEISLFLADKILRYYVSNNPDASDIISSANIISQNNFEILSSVKEILSSDFVFKDKYMNEERYKNPLGLIASVYTQLYGKDYSIYPISGYLNNLDFKPYNPGSVFGRDGFNNNQLFLSGTTMNRWIANSILISNDIKIVDKLLPIDSDTNISSPQDLINIIESKLYIGNNLSSGVVNDNLVKYLTTDDNGNSIKFNLSDKIYKNSKISGLVGMMLTQPEFMMLSGFNQPAQSVSPSNNTDSTNGNKLIIVRVKGGWDWQELVANVSDPKYDSNRGVLKLDSTNSTDLGQGYSINNAASPLITLLNSKEAFLINSVGLPNHARAHDIASRQMETGGELTNGIIGKLFTNSSSSDLISITSQAPKIFSGAQSLQIGSNTLNLYFKKSNTSNTQNYKINILKDIFNSRSFPGNIGVYYSQVLLLDKLSSDDISQGGIGGPGNENITQFPFVEKLIQSGVGKVFYMYADKSYDNHAKEQPFFNTAIKDLFTNVTNFYNNTKGKSKVTIVFFSEFGRTDKVNGGDGTDHGTGGGMIIISNVLKLPEMTGTITPSTDNNNWSTVQIDERDVWSTIFNKLYNTSLDKLYGRTQSIDSYIKVLN